MSASNRQPLPSRPSTRAVVVGVSAVAAVALLRMAPLLGCLRSCVVDFTRLAGEPFAGALLSGADTRLNAWIMAWVQHSLLTAPTSLFHGNVFYPAPYALTGSEHLLGIAIPLLPLALFADNAVLLHQTAIAVSFVASGLGAFAFVAWVTGNAWAATLAGLCTVLMPWRLATLGTVQSGSTQWMLLAWWALLIVLVQEPTRRRTALLVAALSLALMTSFYLASYTLLGIAVLACSVMLARAANLRSTVQAGLALAVAGTVLALTAVPYLSSHAASLAAAGSVPNATPTQVLHWLAPPLSWPWARGDTLPLGSAVPLMVLITAMAAPALMLRGYRCDPRLRVAEAVTAGLLLLALLSFILALGNHWAVGTSSWRLPGYWASQWLPGYSALRAPLRWTVVIGVALPLLAGLGLWRIDCVLPASRRRLLRAVLTAVVVADLAWTPIPVVSAMDWPAGRTQAYRKLERLQPGPVLEVPSPGRGDWEAESMLASTLHWRPLVNGYTRFTPPIHRFLLRVGSELPSPHAAERLYDLAGVRWVLVHEDRLSKQERAAWNRAGEHTALRSVWSGPATQIFEIVGRTEEPQWLHALLSEKSRPTVFSGLPRTALALTPDSAALQAELPQQLVMGNLGRFRHELALRLVNKSPKPWPGFDVDPRGLVALRYALFDGDGRMVFSAIEPLPDDVAANSTLDTTITLRGNTAPGRYDLRIELVQYDEHAVALPLPVRFLQESVVLNSTAR